MSLAALSNVTPIRPNLEAVEAPGWELRSNRMENQKTGYVPLYRSILKQSWAKDVFLRTLWDNLLLMAARQPYTANFKGLEWDLNPGQLVTTAADLGLQLCDRKGKPASRDAVERMLAVFVREEMITIAGEQKKGRVITVNNYTEYAQNLSDFGNLPAQITAHKTAQMPAHGEASNGAGCEGVPAQMAAHCPAQITAHHEQECNNKNINNTSENSNELSDTTPKKSLPVVRPGSAVQSPNGQKWGTDDDLRAAKWIYGKVQEVAPATAEPNWASWANDIRLTRNALNVTHREICEVFAWANADHFWDTNILSPAKLRQKWPRLTAEMVKPSRQRQQQQQQEPAPHWNSAEAWEEFI